MTEQVTDRALTVVHADRLPSVRYGDLARHVTSVQSRGPLQGRCSLTVDATGVGRSFSDVLDEGGADHNRVQITAGANVARSGRFWNVSKLVLLADLASHLETGRLHIAGDLPLADELRREFDSFQVSQSAAGNQIVEVAARGHHGDMVIAVALALFGATRARPGFTGEGQLEGWFG